MAKKKRVIVKSPIIKLINLNLFKKDKIMSKNLTVTFDGKAFHPEPE